MSIDRTKDAALKGLAGRLAALSFRDMQQFAEALDSATPGTTAERLLAVADGILGPSYNPHAPATRGLD